MSGLLLARAARLLGWPPDSWRDGWPDLLTAFEIATLEACDETGKPDRGKRAALLALFRNRPPAPDGERPRGGISLDGWARGPMAPIDAAPVPTYRAASYRQWAARDWPPAPMVAAWMGQDEAAALVQAQGKSEPEQTPQAKQVSVKRYTREGLIQNLSPVMIEPGKLAGLISNACRNGLDSCRNDDGWDLGQVAARLLRKGYLKSGCAESHIQDLIVNSL